jgi:DNA-binding transcriptional MerR regulator
MDVESRSFTARQVVRITGLPYQTLNYWAKIGLVKPSVSAAQGSGSRRLYNFEDLVAIRVALKLRKAGIFGKAMIQILEVLRGMGFDSPAELAIDITPGREVVVTPRAGESFSARRHPGQLLLDFNCDCRGAAAELRHLVCAKEPEAVKTPKATGKAARRARERVEMRNRGLRRRV